MTSQETDDMNSISTMTLISKACRLNRDEIADKSRILHKSSPVTKQRIEWNT